MVQASYLIFGGLLVAGLVTAVLLGGILGTSTTAVVTQPSSPSPSPPTPPTPPPPSPAPGPSPPISSGTIVSWVTGDSVLGLTSTHPLSYNCSYTIVVPQGAVNRSLVEACYSANLSAIIADSDFLCGVIGVANNETTVLTVTCPANCSFAATIVARMEDPGICNLGTISTFVENSLLKPQTTQTGAPPQLDRINQRYPPLDGIFNYTSDGSAFVDAPIIYVADTGVDTAHADFATGRVLGRLDFTAATPTTGDCNGHATAVASQAIGVTVGVAKGAAVMDLRVATCDGLATYSSLLAAMLYLETLGDTGRKVTLVPPSRLAYPCCTDCHH